MMPRPVAHYLMSFEMNAEPRPPAHDAEFAPVTGWSLQAQEPSPAPTEDFESLIEAARERAREEALEAARLEFTAELEAVQQNYRDELAATRQAWIAEEGEVLRGAIATALTEIEARLADGVSKVVTPFIIDALRRQMLAELVETITSLIGDNQAMVMKIGGPADLLDVLRDKLSAVHGSVTYETTDAVDVSVRAEQTLIETQLSAWIARINAAME